MRSRIETLEGRTLLSGGVVRSYGTNGSALITNELYHVTVADSAIDSQGRIVITGSGTTQLRGTIEQRMFVARIGLDGALDGSFAGDGINSGTPRAVSSANAVLPLKGGGYLIAVRRNVGTDALGLLKLGADGYTDASWGDRGFVALPMSVTSMIERADGRIVVAGELSTPDSELQAYDGKTETVLARLLPTGQRDLTLDSSVDSGSAVDGVRIIGVKRSNLESWRNGTTAYSIASGSDGRLVMGFASANYVDWDNFGGHGGPIESARVSLDLRLYSADGTLEQQINVSQDDEPARQFGEIPIPMADIDDRAGVAVPRGDGSIVMVSQRRFDPVASPSIAIATPDPSGTYRVSRRIDHAATLPEFSMDWPLARGILVLKDSSILLGGSITRNGTTRPAVVKLAPNGEVDATFGTAGVLLVPLANGAQQKASGLFLSPDGGIRALIESTTDQADRELRTSLILRDDKPIVSVDSVRRKGDQYRVAVTVRGLSGISVSSLGSNDLRAVDASGRRVALRLVGATLNADGTVSATYRVTRASLAGAASWTLRAQSNAIVDLAGRGVDGRAIGSILL